MTTRCEKCTDLFLKHNSRESYKSRHGLVYLSIVCRDYNTRTNHMVVYFIYELFKKMQILKT